MNFTVPSFLKRSNNYKTKSQKLSKITVPNQVSPKRRGQYKNIMGWIPESSF